jgi:phytoene dehydrogenase-like protein
MTSFDGVVIGAGNNGLTLAAYLARAVMKIAVLERNPRIGGGRLPELRLKRTWTSVPPPEWKH